MSEDREEQVELQLRNMGYSHIHTAAAQQELLLIRASKLIAAVGALAEVGDKASSRIGGLVDAVGELRRDLTSNTQAMIDSQQDLAKSQGKLQFAAFVLSAAVALATIAYTYLEYQAVLVARAANEIQRQSHQ